MIKLELSFNPYKLQTAMKVSGKKASQDLVERICGTEGTDLSVWSASFFPRAVEEFNESVDVTFNGLLRDYEFLEDALKVFPEKGSRLHMGIIAKPEDRLLKLRKLFAEMQRDTPFDILKTDSLKRLFERATNFEFEMAAVATVSSGKSTLINSFLGDELLPARAEATTATIARIHDVDDAKCFRAVAFDVQGNRLAERKPLTLSAMNELNECPETSVVEIYGKVPGISTNTLKLVLTDTPGPNNSRTADHQAHTYRLLKDDFKPMILYILNATALETNDDDALLRDVAEAMKTGGRQSRDRFIFVLNKADEFDPERETVSRKIGDVQKYLEKHGIVDARVFPADARLAKVLRQSISGLPLTAAEKYKILPQHEFNIECERCHFSCFAPLSQACRAELDKMIVEASLDAEKTGDKRRLALAYTGVPAIELAIAEYLEKYALPAKIAKGVESFKDKIENLKIEADTLTAIANDKKKLAQLQETISKLEGILSNADHAQGVKNKILKLNISKELDTALKDSGTKFSQAIRGRVNGVQGKIQAHEAQDFVTKLRGFIPGIQASFVTSIEKALNDVLRVQAQKCIDDYKQYVEAILGELKCPELAKIVVDPTPINVDEALDGYIREESVKVGSHYENESSDWHEGTSIRSCIADLFGWDSFLGKQALVEVDDWETQDFVNISDYLNEKFHPQIRTFEKETRELATTGAEKLVESFKKHFIKRLSSLDAAIKEKIKEQKKALTDERARKRALENNHRNLEWLKSFIAKLNDILEG